MMHAMSDEHTRPDSIPQRIRELGVRVREGRSLRIAAYYVPEAIAWLVNQPHAGLASAAASIGKSARAVQRTLGNVFPGDMLESKDQQRSFLAGATWVLVEVSEAWLEASERERAMAADTNEPTRTQRVLTAVTERLRGGAPLGAKEVLSDASLRSLKLRPDEVSRAFGTLLAQRRVEVVEGKDRRRRLFRYVPSPAPQTHTIASVSVRKPEADFGQWQLELDEAMAMGHELIGTDRGPTTVGPSLVVPGEEFFNAIAGRERNDNEAPPTLCFATDPTDRSMELNLYVDESRTSIDMIATILETTTDPIGIALLRDSASARRFHGRVSVGDTWPTITRVYMKPVSDMTA